MPTWRCQRRSRPPLRLKGTVCRNGRPANRSGRRHPRDGWDPHRENVRIHQMQCEFYSSASLTGLVSRGRKSPYSCPEAAKRRPNDGTWRERFHSSMPTMTAPEQSATGDDGCIALRGSSYQGRQPGRSVAQLHRSHHSLPNQNSLNCSQHWIYQAAWRPASIDRGCFVHGAKGYPDPRSVGLGNQGEPADTESTYKPKFRPLLMHKLVRAATILMKLAWQSITLVQPL